jgi:hypothetical protein
MAGRQIKCITKLPNHEDRHRRIQAVGGAGFYDSEETAIANVKRDPNYYYVSEQGKSVWVWPQNWCALPAKTTAMYTFPLVLALRNSKKRSRKRTSTKRDRTR